MAETMQRWLKKVEDSKNTSSSAKKYDEQLQLDFEQAPKPGTSAMLVSSVSGFTDITASPLGNNRISLEDDEALDPFGLRAPQNQKRSRRINVDQIQFNKEEEAQETNKNNSLSGRVNAELSGGSSSSHSRKEDTTKQVQNPEERRQPLSRRLQLKLDKIVSPKLKRGLDIVAEEKQSAFPLTERKVSIKEH